MKIVKNYKEYEMINGSCGSVYVEDMNVKVRRTLGGFEITNLEGALRTGKECESISLYWNSNMGQIPLVEIMSIKGINDLKEMYEYMKSIEIEPNNWGSRHKVWGEIAADPARGIERSIEVNVQITSKKGVRTFSPFNTKYIKPLKEMPKKWGIAHVIKAVINKQFEGLRCNGKYSDDYVYDAATKFSQGGVEDSLSFIQQIIERPDGWWTSLENRDGRLIVNISCHTFNCNEFNLKLN